MANNVFTNNILGIPFNDFGEKSSLHPLREVVYGDDLELFVLEFEVEVQAHLSPSEQMTMDWSLKLLAKKKTMRGVK